MMATPTDTMAMMREAVAVDAENRVTTSTRMIPRDLIPPTKKKEQTAAPGGEG